MIALVADPVESVRRMWVAIGREIGGHIESCIPCRRNQSCWLRDRLNAEEDRAFDALERARKGVAA